MSNNNNLTEGSVIKKLILFAIPFLLSNFLQAIYGTVDLVVLGRFSTELETAAVIMGAQTMTIVVGIIIGLSIGVSVLVAQYVGAKQDNAAGKTVGTSIILFILIGILLTVIVILLAKPIISLSKLQEESANAAYDYIFTCALGIVFIFIYNAIAASFRGAGFSVGPMIIIIFSGLMNLVLDIIFVSNFGMGAKGAAIATVISQGVAAIIAIVLLIAKRKVLKLGRKTLVVDKEKLKQIIKLGAPTAIQQTVIHISFFVILSIVNGWGEIYSVAYGYVSNIGSYALLPASAIMSAVSAMVGQNIGAKNHSRAIATLKSGLLILAPFSILIFVLVNIFAKYLIYIYTTNEEVVELAVSIIRYFSLEYLAVIGIYCLHGFTNGAGKTLLTMLNGFLSSFVMRIPLALILSGFFGIYGIGLAIALSPLLPTIVASIYIKSGRWKKGNEIIGGEYIAE